MKENLEKLLATLNLIEVHGEGNLNRLLGCIQFVQGIINNLNSAETAQANMSRAESGRRADEAEDE